MTTNIHITSDIHFECIEKTFDVNRLFIMVISLIICYKCWTDFTVYSKLNSQSTKWYNKNKIVMRIERFVFFLYFRNTKRKYERNGKEKNEIRIEAKIYQQTNWSRKLKESVFLHWILRINKMYTVFFKMLLTLLNVSKTTALNWMTFFLFFLWKWTLQFSRCYCYAWNFQMKIEYMSILNAMKRFIFFARHEHSVSIGSNFIFRFFALLKVNGKWL